MVDTTTHEEKKKKKGRGGLESNINKRLGRIRARRKGGGGEGGRGEAERISLQRMKKS